ncbi:uncharacterized protein LOC135371272 [Ornithodoros turicata]|uniref:uncharacterized protein LOC135371272 n=1 Tax=Ornithodoros turicata TaxID=34597 RepID=UPI0031391F04
MLGEQRFKIYRRSWTLHSSRCRRTRLHRPHNPIIITRPYHQLLLPCSVQYKCSTPHRPSDKADLGDGVYIPQDKLDMAMLSSTDSIFVREIARSLWAPEELRGRSVTGKPCQRYLKQGIKAKRALTPRKVGALKRREGFSAGFFSFT